MRIITPIVLGLLLTISLFTSATAQPAHAISTGDPYEIEFYALQSNSVNSPDIYAHRLRVTFKHDVADSIVVDGFWHGRHGGQSIWKARFHPTMPGEWRWTSTFTDTTDTNLHRDSGTVVAAALTSFTNDFDQFGWLKVASTGRHLQHKSGKPFFWQGDTAWEIAWKSTDSQVDSYIVDRKAKGYNAVYLVVESHQYLYDWGVENRERHLMFLEHDYSRINPLYFEYLDRVISKINRAGMVAVIVPLWASLTEVHHDPDVHGRFISRQQSFNLARYVGARYAGHNVVWIIGGDNKYDTTEKRVFWAEFAEILHDASGRRHLRTVHPDGYMASFDYFDFGTPWIDFHMYHSSHLQSSDATRILGLRGWQQAPKKPVLNGEPAFEDIPAYFWQEETPVRISAYDVRQAAWESFLAGGLMGTTYGANGVWQWHVPDMEASHNPQNYVVESLNLPGSSQVGKVKDYFSGINWWDIIPDPDLATSTVTDLVPVGAKLGRKAWVYLPHGLSHFQLNNKFEQTHVVIKWIKPENLEIADVDTLRWASGSSSLNIPVADSRDWLLEISAENIRGVEAYVNRRHEITLSSTNGYLKPQRNINLWVTFTHESGHTEMLRGYWDGGTIWKIRFKPALTGAWTWTTNCSDPTNVGLHNRTGVFDVVVGPEDDPELGKVKQRLKVAENGRTLAWDDGTPFFWLGDTVWEMAWKSTPEQLEAYLDDRQSKGYSVIQVVTMSHQVFQSFGVENRLGVQYFLNEDLDQLNPRYFDYVDHIVKEAGKRDMVVALVPLWAYMMELHYVPEYHAYNLSIEQSMNVADYVGARYAGDDVMWIVGGDNAYTTPQMKQFWTDWAIRLKNASGGWHLMTIHPKGYASSFDFFPPETPWMDLQMYQSSHLAGGDYTWQAARRGFALSPVKPVINGEPSYEDIYHNLWEPGDTVSVATFRIRPEHVRQAAWESLLSGATGGVTYGGNGVWQWHIPEIPGSHNPRFFVEEAWQFPGSTHMGVMRRIAEEVEWFSWVPRHDLVLASIAPDIIPLSMNEMGMLAYLPMGTTKITLDLYSLGKNARYQWINPTTGDRSSVTMISQDTLGLARDFRPPNDQDWILHVFKPGSFGTDLGEEPELPDQFQVYPAFPNPFNPTTRLVFEIPGSSMVTIDVFSVDGRLIRRVFEQDRPQGMHTAVFNAQGLGSGMYIARITTVYGVKSVKMTLVK
jgi:hypothetical protein